MFLGKIKKENQQPCHPQHGKQASGGMGRGWLGKERKGDEMICRICGASLEREEVDLCDDCFELYEKESE